MAKFKETMLKILSAIGVFALGVLTFIFGRTAYNRKRTRNNDKTATDSSGADLRQSLDRNGELNIRGRTQLDVERDRLAREVTSVRDERERLERERSVIDSTRKSIRNLNNPE